jgi:isopenicillin N synthase-like dioxygenase
MAGLTKKVHSPLHRVMTTPSPRMSLVYFGYPEFKASLPPLRDTEHSLYMNQGSFESTIEPKSFGDFITTKWASVQRP